MIIKHAFVITVIFFTSFLTVLYFNFKNKIKEKDKIIEDQKKIIEGKETYINTIYYQLFLLGNALKTLKSAPPQDEKIDEENIDKKEKIIH